MMAKKIAYKSGYKYQLKADYASKTGVIPHKEIYTEFILLEVDGTLTLAAGYAWDGPSGPTFDSPSFMRGSLEHDAFYQLMRLGLLPPEYRKLADERLRTVCLEDGMWPIRAEWVYLAVRMYGASSARYGTERPLLSAPS